MMPTTKFFLMQREDGETVDIPEKHLVATQKRHPLWVIVKEVIPGRLDSGMPMHPEPPVIEADPFECKLCGEVMKSETGIKIHTTRLHGNSA